MREACPLFIDSMRGVLRGTAGEITNQLPNLCAQAQISVSATPPELDTDYHNISYVIIYLLKSDYTNSKHQHRVNELDKQGSEGALTAAYRNKN